MLGNCLSHRVPEPCFRLIGIGMALVLSGCAVRDIDWPSGRLQTARETWVRWDPLWPTRPTSMIFIRSMRVESSGLPAGDGASWEIQAKSGSDWSQALVRLPRIRWESLSAPVPTPPVLDLERWKVDSPQALIVATTRLGSGPYSLDLRQRSISGSPMWLIHDAASKSCLVDAGSGELQP